MIAAQNHLLDLLPRKDRLRLLAACEVVVLVPGQTLWPPGKLQRHAYFPTQGLISRVARFDHRADLEVGLVGREGMLGESLLLGVTSAPWRGLVILPGQAFRIGERALRSELVRNPALRRVMDRYLALRLEQMVEAAGCLRFHEIGPRLARWMLASLDRDGEVDIRVTHETLARLLGVRRVGVTIAAGALQRQGLIAYHHGKVSLRDRGGLAAVACSCYQADTRSYQRLLGDPWPKPRQVSAA